MNHTAAGLTSKTASSFIDRLGSRIFQEMNTRSGAFFDEFQKSFSK
jgi:hypothetical protein